MVFVFISKITGTPVAFSRGFICIIWERNLVPIIKCSNVLCSMYFPPSTTGNTAAWWACSLSQAPTMIPVTSRGIFHEVKTLLSSLHILFLTPAWMCCFHDDSSDPDPQLIASQPCERVEVCWFIQGNTWLSFSGTTLDLHWCKRTWNEVQGQRNWAQTDLYIK